MVCKIFQIRQIKTNCEEGKELDYLLHLNNQPFLPQIDADFSKNKNTHFKNAVVVESFRHPTEKILNNMTKWYIVK